MKLIWQCCTKAVFYHSDILSTQSKKQLTGKTSILQLQRNPCSWRSGGVSPATFTIQNNWEDIGWLSTVIEQFTEFSVLWRRLLCNRDKHGFIMDYCHLTQNHGDDFLTSLWQMVYKFILTSCEKYRYTSSLENYM